VKKKFFFLVSPPDEYLQTATRKLTINELHQHAQDTRSLYQEFWVCRIQKENQLFCYYFYFSRLYQQIILKNFVFLVLVQKIVMVQFLPVKFQTKFALFKIKFSFFLR